MNRKQKNRHPLSITPLGGVREIGRNCFVIECEDEVILLDAGLIFPSEDQYGVDIIIPNFEYLIERKDRLKGILVTHGHEDHIGALPYLFRDVSAKIHTTRLTAGLIRNKFVESPDSNKLNFELITPGDTFKIGENFEISTALLNHSIPAGLGYRIKTPCGTIVHSGDFKLDQTPINDERTDLHIFAAWGQEKTDILVIDTTNVYTPGFTPSEKRIGVTFKNIFQNSPGRIFIALFSSHFHRIQQGLDVAQETGRKVVVLGRSMVLNFNTAHELGYLNVPDGIVIDSDKMDSCKDSELLIFATGSQGEPMSVLTRMSSANYPVSIKEGDTVILSANPIPGNETAIGNNINRLFQMGADVITSETQEVHVSGHGAREEIKILLNTVNPSYVMPFHGEYRQFAEFQKLAVKMGWKASDIILSSPGDRVVLKNDEISLQKGVTGGEILVRGDVIEDEWTHLANERATLASGGVLNALVYYNRQKRKFEKVEFTSRGFVNPHNWMHLFETAETSILSSLNAMDHKRNLDYSVIQERAAQKISRLVLRFTGLRPMIIVLVIEV